MKRTSIVLSVLVLLSCIYCMMAGAQGRQHVIMFYNVENVFDTLSSHGVLDDEFTPRGSMRWNGSKYRRKMENLGRVFNSLARESGHFPTVIGLAEVENRNVLEDIAALPGMSEAGYGIVHYEGPDARGIDVALLYRPDRFRLEGSAPVKTLVAGERGLRTRDILTAWGTIDGERFMFMVAHWPSRSEGQKSSEPRRIGAAQTMRDVIDLELSRHPETKIILMGDLNDDPSNRSVAEILGGKPDIEDARLPDELFNPYYRLHKDGYGSLAYRDTWNMFDNIIVSGNLTRGNLENGSTEGGNSSSSDSQRGGYRLWKPYRSKYWGFIYDRPWLRQQSGQYKGYPHRTYVAGRFEGGYSDHFPVYIYICKSED